MYWIFTPISVKIPYILSSVLMAKFPKMLAIIVNTRLCLDIQHFSAFWSHLKTRGTRFNTWYCLEKQQIKNCDSYLKAFKYLMLLQAKFSPFVCLNWELCIIFFKYSYKNFLQVFWQMSCHSPGNNVYFGAFWR